jgi:hypothetical protein
MGVQHSGITQKKKDKIKVCLQRIEMLVDNAAYNSIYFDGFMGYNQIKMA